MAVRVRAGLGIVVVLSLGVAVQTNAPVSAAAHACPARPHQSSDKGCEKTVGGSVASVPMRTVTQSGTTGGGYIAAGRGKHHHSIRH